jgi:hypothetical protein
MHDIDRTTMEFGETGFEAEQFEFGGQGEWSGEGGLLSEQEEMELANELLTVNNEQELEQFLGDLIKKVGSIGGKILKSPIGQAIGGVLKGVAKKALPLAGGALGGFFGGPLGAKIGSGLASAAGGALGLESEGLSGEDREFEGARQFVKLAADIVGKAAQAPGGDPRAIAQAAALAAARQFAPGLLGRPNGAGQQQSGQQQYGQQQPGQQAMLGARRQGRWARQGNKIVLFGL